MFLITTLSNENDDQIVLCVYCLRQMHISDPFLRSTWMEILKVAKIFFFFLILVLKEVSYILYLILSFGTTASQDWELLVDRKILSGPLGSECSTGKHPTKDNRCSQGCWCPHASCMNS